ncbi:MAG: MaoC/PaaZ C-terminal domain-containing protein [Bacillota bacterium]|nr:MaoC/PaaZ C-terminal domain-containing protein [Bacillota bacterium]
MGLYYEDFSLEQKFISSGRTITETDIVNFSGISGDFNPLHTDKTFAESTIFKKRIAHGMLIVSVMTGLTAKMGIFEGTAIGLLSIDEWKFKRPVFLNDTIHLEMEIIEKIETSKTDRGIIIRKVNVLNQNSQIIQEGKISVMMRKYSQEDKHE